MSTTLSTEEEQEETRFSKKPGFKEEEFLYNVLPPPECNNCIQASGQDSPSGQTAIFALRPACEFCIQASVKFVHPGCQSAKTAFQVSAKFA